jgi:hypothetical protein
MTNANFNYLGRKKLQKPKHFDITKAKNNLTDVLTIDISLKKQFINLIDESEIIRIEASTSKGLYSVADLMATVDAQSVSLDGFLVTETPSLRVFTVLKEDRARLIRASSNFNFTTSKPKRKRKRDKLSVPVRREGFFDPYIDEALGSMPFKLDWEAGLVIRMNSRIYHLYNEEPASDPTFCTLVFPFLVKEILFGIILRFDHKGDLDDVAQKWLTWSEQVCLAEDGLDQPKEEFKSDGTINESWVDWIETVYELFCSGRYLKNMTLLEAMESSYEYKS